jgi:hypothetical protein
MSLFGPAPYGVYRADIIIIIFIIIVFVIVFILNS